MPPGYDHCQDGCSAYTASLNCGSSTRVIHEQNFADTVAGVHADNVENYWKGASASSSGYMVQVGNSSLFISTDLCGIGSTANNIRKMGQFHPNYGSQLLRINNIKVIPCYHRLVQGPVNYI